MKTKRHVLMGVVWIFLVSLIAISAVPSLAYAGIVVTINILSGGFPKNINPKSQGVVPVAILSTDTFDATTVDPLSVKFGPKGAIETHGKGHIEDVDGDGRLDLVLHFRIRDIGITSEDTAVSLTGKTFSGQAISTESIIEVVYFGANDGTNGTELWKTDGTEAGTVLVKDINPGTSGSSPAGFINFNGAVYFTAFTDAAGLELWKTDGTDAGTVPVKDINPGPSDSFSAFTRSGFAVLNGMLYFYANDGTSGTELWRTDGTEAGTVMVKDINPGTNGSTSTSFSSEFVLLNGALYFQANDGTHGNELWKTDGTATGTVLVKDINAGFGSSDINSFFVFNGEIYFSAFNSTYGRELWKTDGTDAGTILVKDVFQGSESSRPGNFSVLSGELYFVAEDRVGGLEIWKTDGFEAGTARVKDINPGTFGSNPDGALTAFGDSLYFGATDGASGKELWKTNGSDVGTVRVKDINPGIGSSLPRDFIVSNGVLYFTANDGPGGREMWKTDGTDIGTMRVANISPFGSAIGLSAFSKIVNGTLLFYANDGTSGIELWKTDGTEAGTIRVKDICPGACSALPSF